STPIRASASSGSTTPRSSSSSPSTRAIFRPASTAEATRAPRVSYVGQRLTRREDERLLQGRGAYVADVRRPDTLHLAVVRSPHAHARIRAIDVAAARACPGVVDVVTFDDVPELARVIPLRLGERGQTRRLL